MIEYEKQISMHLVQQVYKVCSSVYCCVEIKELTWEEKWIK
jgi:hypothetical protein